LLYINDPYETALLFITERVQNFWLRFTLPFRISSLKNNNILLQTKRWTTQDISQPACEPKGINLQKILKTFYQGKDNKEHLSHQWTSLILPYN